MGINKITDEIITPAKRTFEGSNNLPLLYFAFALIIANMIELIKHIAEIIKKIVHSIIYPSDASVSVSKKLSTLTATN